MKTIICPVSNQSLIASSVRLTGFTMASFLIGFLLTNWLPLLLFVVIDYFIRGFTHLNSSPGSWLANQLVVWWELPQRRINKGPKIFAARLGFLCAIGAVISYLFFPSWSIPIATMLCTFALLESLGNLCVGCHIYTLLLKLF